MFNTPEDFDKLLERADRILRDHLSGRKMMHLQGGSTVRGEAIIYGYKDSRVVAKRLVKLGNLEELKDWNLKIVQAKAELVIKGYEPVVRYPEFMSGEPMRRSREEIEYDRSQDNANLWSPLDGEPKSGNMIVGGQPINPPESDLDALLDDPDAARATEPDDLAIDPEDLETTVRVASKSRPDQEHIVVIGNGNALRCTCEGNRVWRKTCSHMKKAEGMVS